MKNTTLNTFNGICMRYINLNSELCASHMNEHNYFNSNTNR